MTEIMAMVIYIIMLIMGSLTTYTEEARRGHQYIV